MLMWGWDGRKSIIYEAGNIQNYFSEVLFLWLVWELPYLSASVLYYVSSFYGWCRLVDQAFPSVPKPHGPIEEEKTKTPINCVCTD